MKKKLTGTQIRLVLCLVIVAIFVLAYQYIYTRYESLADELNTKTKAAKLEIAQRESDLAEEDSLKTKTEDLKSQYEIIIASLPVNITKEDNLIFIEKLEKDLGINIPSVDVQDTSEFYTTILPIRDENGVEIIASGQSANTTADASSVSSTGTAGTTATSATATGTTATGATATGTTATGATATGATATGTTATGTTATGATATGTTTTDAAASGNTDAAPTTAASGDSENTTGQQYMTGLVSSININFQTTYEDFKKLVDYINNYPEKTSISNASLSYDSSTGELIGSMTINRYALTGTGKVYEEPYIGDISIGTDNIFGNGAKAGTSSGGTTNDTSNDGN